MAETTTNLNLTKPSEDDFYDVNVQNENMDIIDEKLLSKTGDASNTTNTFAQATTRANLSTGEKTSVSLGKLMKWYADLKAAAWATISSSGSDFASNGTASPGTTAKVADAGHIHPTDTTRQAKISATGILKGDGSGGVLPAIVGEDYIAPLGDGSNLTNIFTQSSTRSNINTSEKLSVSLGKLMKWFADFGNSAWATISNLASDYKANGTASPGSTGKVADAGHVHPTDNTRAADSAVVHKTGNETIDGIKTFSSSPVVPTQTQTDRSTNVASTEYVRTGLDLKLNSALKGASNGLAELDSGGKVPSSQLPSFVDDVLEFSTVSLFPTTGESGKIYIALDTNISYRWSGSVYVKIASDLALGETSSTAYRGDRGKVAYDHSQITGTNPHGVTKTNVGLSNVDNTADSAKAVLSASKWTTARTLTVTGDISGSVGIDGSSGMLLTLSLPNTGVTPGTYGAVTVDAKGKVTGASNAEGTGNVASGSNSHSEGSNNSSTGVNSHTEGNGNNAQGNASHAEGYGTSALGNNGSHSEGNATVALGNSSHTEGYGTVTGNMVPSISTDSTTAGSYAHAEGNGTMAYGNSSHSEGKGSKSLGNYSHAEGLNTVASGNQSHSEGDSSVASGDNSHAEGNLNVASSVNSHAEGYMTTAMGNNSHAEGNVTTASGTSSHAEGDSTESSGTNSHAEGSTTTAKGSGSHAEGSTNIANGSFSHVEGYQNGAASNYSHAEGRYSLASHGILYNITAFVDSTKTITLDNVTGLAVGDLLDIKITSLPALIDVSIVSISGLNVKLNTTATLTSNWLYAIEKQSNQTTIHAEGHNTLCSGGAAHSEGAYTVADGDQSHAEGNSTKALGAYSHSEGNATVASHVCSHAEGWGTVAGVDGTTNLASDTTAGRYTHAEGNGTQASGNSAHSEGKNTTASGSYSHSEGQNTSATNNCSHAEGFSTTSGGVTSHAEGNATQANANQSHAEGLNTVANGTNSHAEGNITTSGGTNSHSEGYNTTASGESSHAEGSSSTSSGTASHAQNGNTVAQGFCQTAIGYYNIVQGTGTSYVASDNAFIIGKGTSTTRANAFRVTYSGAVYGLSAFNSTGADYSEYFEWLDKNIDNEDRVGYFVTLEGDKIRKAVSSDEFIIGVISSTPSVVGDSHQDEWNNKYITDEWGRIQYEWTKDIIDGKEIDAYIPALNPEYNPTQIYVPRENRPEWSAVGMIGKLYVRDDGTCEVNKYCLSNNEGIATNSASGYRVLRRLSDNIIQVLIK